uniref:Uncharacterized protein n=1 Tax=Magallana gigas TaxID=29159 RepID=A0A8W8M7I2_MAGGI
MTTPRGTTNIPQSSPRTAVRRNLLTEFNEVDSPVCPMYREDLNTPCVETELATTEGTAYVSNSTGWGQLIGFWFGVIPIFTTLLYVAYQFFPGGIEGEWRSSSPGKRRAAEAVGHASDGYIDWPGANSDNDSSSSNYQRTTTNDKLVDDENGRDVTEESEDFPSCYKINASKNKRGFYVDGLIQVPGNNACLRRTNWIIASQDISVPPGHEVVIQTEFTYPENSEGIPVVLSEFLHKHKLLVARTLLNARTFNGYLRLFNLGRAVVTVKRNARIAIFSPVIKVSNSERLNSEEVYLVEEKNPKELPAHLIPVYEKEMPSKTVNTPELDPSSNSKDAAETPRVGKANAPKTNPKLCIPIQDPPRTDQPRDQQTVGMPKKTMRGRVIRKPQRYYEDCIM